MTADQPRDSRNYYRLRYPVAARPAFRADDGNFEVLELSEAGMRLRPLDPRTASPTPPGHPLRGEVTFCDQSRVSVEGVVERRESDELVLRLSSGVDLQRMIVEQRQLLSRFVVPRSDRS